MDIFTIGFTQTTAEDFFGRLREAGVRRVLDVRLHNTSQLAGWAKAQDLPFFLRELVGADYRHEPRLSPSQDLFDHVKKRKGDWSIYEEGFLALLAERRPETFLSSEEFAAVPTALLCSEATAERCHRRLICEYLAGHWPDLRAVHL